MAKKSKINRNEHRKATVAKYAARPHRLPADVLAAISDGERLTHYFCPKLGAVTRAANNSAPRLSTLTLGPPVLEFVVT